MYKAFRTRPGIESALHFSNYYTVPLSNVVNITGGGLWYKHFSHMRK